MVTHATPVDLPADLHAKLQGQVDTGRFDSVEAALTEAVERLIARVPAEDAEAVNDLLLHAIAESKSGELFDGQPIGRPVPAATKNASEQKGDAEE